MSSIKEYNSSMALAELEDVKHKHGVIMMAVSMCDEIDISEAEEILNYLKLIENHINSLKYETENFGR